MLFGGMAHRRADHVAKHVDELGEAIEAVEDQLREVGARAERPAIPGMPLPTGYGLQVRGPDNESIVLPVCLPPGFELDSMVLCPEFLPRDQPQPESEAAPAVAPAPEPVAVLPVCARAPALRERLSGTLQYVFGTANRASAWTRRSAGPSRPMRRPMRSLASRQRHRDASPGLEPRVRTLEASSEKRPGERSGDQERCRDHGAGDAVGVDELANDEVAAGRAAA